MEELTLNDFNGLVYHYGANGTKAVEGLSEAQQEVIYLAWTRSQLIEDEVEADSEINSYYKDFLKAGSKVEKKYVGYGYHGGGRKALPAEEKKSKRIALRLTEAQFKLLSEKAEKENLSISAFIIKKILEK